ncbi:MAG TPA: peptidylprolyl isomerase [Candidatus Fimadaptatus faecigallinarum]|uniref:Peptidyl-prolyl cis-trans isomerase n=1 Tax=Candidatus Fimadaptatus faecigallinarum TaxID=2840814 RepID=A0A9D1LT52_9FIRM|nr:peptidylprolyl isomerase [Candidatus Fimadaptatus faecigallinarum]
MAMKRLLLMLTALTLALALGGCALLERNDATPTRDPNAQNPVATITMENGAVMTAELYPEYAPNTVANFIELANSGFYDGIKFHRVVKGFVIQAGQASTAGRDELDYTISGEFSSNGYEGNTLKHVKGVLSMARTSEPDSASGQFFIVVADAPDYLDGEYAAFGALVDDDSIAVAEKISKVAVNSNNVPVNDQTIASIRVETFGQEYTVQKLQ